MDRVFFFQILLLVNIAAAMKDCVFMCKLDGNESKKAKINLIARCLLMPFLIIPIYV